MMGILSGQLSPLGVSLANRYKPGGVDGLVLALDASVLTGASGVAVTTVADRSRVGEAAYQVAAGNAPTLTPGGMNGLPTLRFNGADQWLNVDSIYARLAEGGAAVGAEIFLVAKKTAPIPTDGIPTGLWRFNNATQNSHLIWVDGHIYDSFVSGERPAVAAPTQAALFAGFLYGFAVGEGQTQVFFNNVQTYSGAGTVVGEGLFTQPATIGTSNMSSFFYQGDIGEILIYNRRLTPAERNAVASFLAAKWGLP
jgi:hypothetical protein